MTTEMPARPVEVEKGKRQGKRPQWRMEEVGRHAKPMDDEDDDNDDDDDDEDDEDDDDDDEVEDDDGGDDDDEDEDDDAQQHWSDQNVL